MSLQTFCFQILVFLIQFLQIVLAENERLAEPLGLYGKDVKYSCIKHAVQFCHHFDFFLCLGQVK